MCNSLLQVLAEVDLDQDLILDAIGQDLGQGDVVDQGLDTGGQGQDEDLDLVEGQSQEGQDPGARSPNLSKNNSVSSTFPNIFLCVKQMHIK